MKKAAVPREFSVRSREFAGFATRAAGRANPRLPAPSNILPFIIPAFRAKRNPSEGKKPSEKSEPPNPKKERERAAALSHKKPVKKETFRPPDHGRAREGRSPLA